MEYRNVSLERRVAGKRRHYSTYYNWRTRRLVEEIYARDLDLLGYEFEDENRTSVLVPLYEMNQLRQQREEVEKRLEGNPFWDMGFRFQMFPMLFLGQTDDQANLAQIPARCYSEEYPEEFRVESHIPNSILITYKTQVGTRGALEPSASWGRRHLAGVDCR